MAETTLHRFGPEHAAAAPEALTRATPTLGAFKLRLLAGFDQLSFPIIRRMRSILQPNIRRIPNNGVEDHGLVDFYEDTRGSSLVRGLRDTRQLMELNPRVPRFDVIGGGEGSGALGHEVYVVFEISGREVYRRYPETLCQYLTHWVGGSWGCYCHSLSKAVR